MAQPLTEVIEDLRRQCSDPDCPLGLTVDELAAPIPGDLAWTKAMIARDAIAISLHCGPTQCCMRPFLEEIQDAVETMVLER